MAVRPLVLWPDPRLSRACAAVDPGDAALPGLIADLFDTLYAARGRGLAAPQIGVMVRVCVIDVTWKEGAPTPRAFVNPVLRATRGALCDGTEQCLSIPDLPMTVARPPAIEIAWQSPGGHRQETGAFDGAEARCLLHEMDHLDGRVILDRQPPGLRRDLEAAYAG